MKRRKIYLLVMMILGIISLVYQFILLMTSAAAPFAELLIRFFSYFTIENNLLVTVFAGARFFNTRSNPKDFFARASVQTAITIYIIVVGIVYNTVLKSLWAPTGAQFVIDLVLHTVMPLLMLIYWIFWVDTRKLHLSNIPAWIIYPVLYAVYSLVRGYFVNWYPYPFLNINELGLNKVLMTTGLMVVAFVLLSVLFVYVGRHKRR